MISNMGPIERAVRITAGVVLLGIVVLWPNSWRWIGLIGVVPLLTGLSGWCPIYAWLTQD
jgi:hypothetical protein